MDTERTTTPHAPMRKDILPAEEQGYTLHVISSYLKAYLDHGDPAYLIGVRKTAELADGWQVRRASWDSPSELVEMKGAPLPGSDGRAVCYIRTKGPITIYWDAVDPVSKKPEPAKKVTNAPC